MGYSPWGCKESDMTRVHTHSHAGDMTCFESFLLHKGQHSSAKICVFLINELVWLHRVIVRHAGSLIFVAVCGIQFPDQGSNPVTLHQEHRVLATGPAGKFHH